ncbi:MAG: helix-turn-helix domain-containing protein [Solirubrobacteraceae bacterium]
MRSSSAATSETVRTSSRVILTTKYGSLIALITLLRIEGHALSDHELDPVEDPWLTLAEIAEELRLSPATIRSWIAKGTLQAMRAGQRKFLVRRSELDRMLRGEDYEDAAPPPPGPVEPGRRVRQRRAPDAISAPNVRAWATDEEHVDPEDWLGVAEWEWLAALQTSRMAPPDVWFAGRLRQIADAAASKAGALGLFDDDEEMRWEGEPIAEDFTLSYELRPGGNRPGPPKLWQQFDRRVDRLGQAMRLARAGAIRSALEDLSLTLHDIADSLERYRARYGNWTERSTRRPAKDAEGGAGPGSAATE